jgi:hypothetical protein
VVDHLARQMLAHGKVTPRATLAARLDAVTLDQVRAAGVNLLKGPVTLALVGPKLKLPSLAALMPATVPAPVGE